MWIFGAAGRAAILKLECPHCNQTHAYAREAPTIPLSCKGCGKSFTREESEALAAKGR
ncbi:MAG: hypothetical protein U0174_16750 [Polyangiaceae bacterium]